MSTPAMKQWFEIKEKYPEHILMFRMGDFYEMFYQDANKASKILGITLTKRGSKEKIPLAGIPYKSLDQYLKKLVDANQKVIIVEQLEDPKKAKGIVKRGIVREITPGTVAFSEMINRNENNYIASLFIEDKYSLFFSDITTGDIFYYVGESLDEIKTQLYLYLPKEILIPDYFDLTQFDDNVKNDFYFTKLNSQYYNLNTIKPFVLTFFNSFHDNFLIVGLGMLLKYISHTQHNDLSYFKKPIELKGASYVYLDEITIRNLDILKNSYSGNQKGSLYNVMNDTETAFGARLLKRFLIKPLINRDEIYKRLNIVETFVNDVVGLESIKALLREIFDIERIISKVFNDTVKPIDLIRLKQSLELYPEIYDILIKRIDIPKPEELTSLLTILNNSLNDDFTSDYIIKKGFNSELDELREIKHSATKYLQQFEITEREKTKLQGLKVKYNKVFGFFIEIPKAQAKNVPPNYQRKQTLVNAERYITPELKVFENKYLSAEERIKELENDLFKRIVDSIKPFYKIIQIISEKLAFIDVLTSFASVALKYNYTKPILDGKDILISQGRHPVVERLTDFVSNNTTLFDENVHIITGPNMSGKSTYLRQLALIQILAQVGSFVPAQNAKLSLVDAIFTRIGARDNLIHGESTFMVEMKETSNILSKATRNSLIIMDEVGRGTSTYDGISLAWSITEYILLFIKAKTLFATHYHVLTHLEHFYETVRNYHTLVDEKQGQIIFKRKIVDGGLDKSYGIDVAKLANLPKWVLERASLLQNGFEKYDNLKDNVVRTLFDTISRNPISSNQKIKNHNVSHVDSENSKMNKNQNNNLKKWF